MIINSVNPLTEALAYIDRKSSQELNFKAQVEFILKDKKKNMEYNEALLEEILEPLFRFEKAMDSCVDLSDIAQSKYFIPFRSGIFPINGHCIANLLLYGAITKPYKSLDDSFYALSMRSESEMFADALFFFDENANVIKTAHKGISLRDFMKKVDFIECDNQAKWQIMNAFGEPDVCYNEIKRLISPVVEAVQKNLYICGNLLDGFRVKYDSMDKFLSVMEQRLPQNLSVNLSSKSYVFPSIMAHSTIMLFESFDFKNKAPAASAAYVGLLEESITNTLSRQKMQLFVEPYVMKAIGDPLRYKILKYLNGHDAYGNEIAKELNIQPNLIHHHTATLQSAGIVIAIIEGNRVYYRLNKELLKRIIVQIQRELID